MSSGRKITDLERLTQPGGKVLPDDESIPVLTERLSLPSLELDISLPEGVEADAGLLEPEDAETPATAFPEPSPDFMDSTPAVSEAAIEPPASAEANQPDAVVVDWVRVEDDAREALLHELQSRLASELDRQLRERLQPTLVRMLLATMTELRPSIEAAVRESVARVVAAEVARQRSGQ